MTATLPTEGDAAQPALRVLVADDDYVSRQLATQLVRRWGHVAVPAEDGEQALRTMLAPGAPRIALLDWMMPGLDGVEVCRRLREADSPAWVIMVTARDRTDDLVAALRAGANDYVTKPVDKAALEARLAVACRVVGLQHALRRRVDALEQAMSRVRELSGLLPMCCYCKRIRDDREYWSRVEDYVAAHTNARVTHGICPECLERALES